MVQWEATPTVTGVPLASFGSSHLDERIPSDADIACNHTNHTSLTTN